MKTYRKMLWRGIKATRARFFSILAIVMVGCGFLAGLLATTPDMQYTADKYYDDNRLFDIDVRGALGMTEDDVAALRDVDEIDQIMPAYVTDLEMKTDDGSYVTRIYGVPLDEEGTDGFLNDFVLVEGRMPQNASECLIASPNGYTTAHKLGETYTVSDGNKDYDKLSDTYNFTELTAVGIVSSPYYMSVESEPSTVGSGTVGLIMFVRPECYALDVYTDVFLTVKGAAGMDSFTDDYLDLIDSVSGKLEDMGPARCAIRYSDVVGDAQQKLDDAKKEYDDAKTDADTELADARKELDDGWQELRDGRRELDDGWADLADAKDEYEDGYSQWKNGKLDLNDSIKLLEKQQQEQIDKLAPMKPYMSEEQYQAALQQINAAFAEGWRAIGEARTTLGESKDKLDEAKQDIADAEQELNDREADYADARKKLVDGEADYLEAQTDANTELADAAAKISDAQQEINDIETPEWYVTDRRDTVSYSSYKSNSNKIGAIAKVFPIFFFAVAALVALTTMTRMVEEERGQEGTLKALGYSDGVITAYYIGYSAIASLIGAVAGIVLGFKSLPLVISNAYGMMYTLPRVITVFRWNYALIIVPVAVLCTTVATLAACMSQMRERPARLMLPKAPQAGKRVLLERIGFIWKRLSFIKKVTARNIFRYKKRLYMTVFGIAGCCALLLTGFGVRDSIHDIVGKQFGELYHYDLSLTLKEDGAAESDAVVRSFLEGSDVASFAVAHTESAHVETAEGDQKVSLLVPQDNDALAQQMTFRQRRSHAAVDFGEDSVLLTEKLCETLKISAGDTVTLRDADGREARVTVTGVIENYLSNCVYLSAQQYEELYGAAPEYKQALVTLSEDAAADDVISKEVLQSDNVLLVQFTQTIRDSFQNTVKSIDYIVMVLIVSAGALAVIVLYNLTNINICERKKELATIKVLGFRDREVASYIFRETWALCAMGILAGFVLGVWLHSFVVRTAEVDAVMFGRVIKPLSYVFSTVVTLFFTFVVNLIMRRKLRGINMVESMKANE